MAGFSVKLKVSMDAKEKIVKLGTGEAHCENLSDEQFAALDELVFTRTGEKYDATDEAVTSVIVDESDDVIGFVLNGKKYYTPGKEPFITEEELLESIEIPPAMLEELTKNLNVSPDKFIKYFEEKRKDVKLPRNKTKLASDIRLYIENKKIKNVVKTQGDRDNVLEDVKQLVAKKEEEIRRKLSSSVKHNAARTNISRISVPKRSFAGSSALKKVNSLPPSKVTPVTNQFIKDINEIFDPATAIEYIQFVKSPSADIIVPNKKYKIPKISEPNTSYYKSLAKAEKAKLLFLIFRGCYAAATYFQMLVSNTPVDEDYTYEKEVIVKSRASVYATSKGAYGGKVKTKEQLSEDINVRIEKRKVKHKADKHSVRGDWILTFRGKNFKAYETAPEKNSLTANVDYTFSENLFFEKEKKESIEKIADILYEQTKDSDDFSSTFVKFNINPRWEVLEKGGYINQSEAKFGSRYAHGVASTKLTYQAPKGFIAITDATWETLINTGKWAGSIDGFINSRRNKLDVSNLNSKLVKEVFKRHPSLKNTSRNFTGVYKK